jgi:hypothetical protein
METCGGGPGETISQGLRGFEVSRSSEEARNPIRGRRISTENRQLLGYSEAPEARAGE